MAPLFFRIILALIIVYALIRGRHDERVVALICLAGAVASHIVVSPVSHRYGEVEWGVMYVDMGVLAGFVMVALRTDRFWPLWVAGLQLTTVIGHLLKGLRVDLLPLAYGAALQFWSLPIILILAVGTWRSHRRWLAKIGPT